MSVPVALKLTQPLFGVNRLKWSRRMEPLGYAKAKAAFISATEEVTMRTITFYFHLLLARENVMTALQNRKNADYLYEVAQAKRKMGRFRKTNSCSSGSAGSQAKAVLTEAESEQNAKMFQLRSFLGMGEEEVVVPVVPGEVESVQMEY